MPLQAAHQLGNKGAGAWGIGSRHIGDHHDQVGGIVFRRLQHFRHPAVGQIAFLLGLRDFHADAAQVFDQRQAQHAGQRPEFAERQIDFFLIGGDIPREAFGVPVAVTVRDGFGSHVIDPRTVMRRRQLRQTATEGFRQVVAHNADLLFNQIVIVQQPFAGGSHAGFLAVAELVAAFRQNAFVVVQTLQQVVGRFARCQFMGTRQALPVTLHLIDRK